MTKIYDCIKMLDTEGYPKAFIENKKAKYNFFDAKIKKSNDLIRIKKVFCTNLCASKVRLDYYANFVLLRGIYE